MAKLQSYFLGHCSSLNQGQYSANYLGLIWTQGLKWVPAPVYWNRLYWGFFGLIVLKWLQERTLGAGTTNGHKSGHRVPVWKPFLFWGNPLRTRSLRSRRLEVVGERENGRAQGRRARGEGTFPLASPFLLLARPFFLVPTTSKRLLRRLRVRC